MCLITNDTIQKYDNHYFKTMHITLIQNYVFISVTL